MLKRAIRWMLALNLQYGGLLLIFHRECKEMTGNFFENIFKKRRRVSHLRIGRGRGRGYRTLLSSIRSTAYVRFPPWQYVRITQLSDNKGIYRMSQSI